MTKRQDPGHCLDPPSPTSLGTARPEILSPPAQPTHSLTRLLFVLWAFAFLNFGAKERDFRFLDNPMT